MVDGRVQPQGVGRRLVDERIRGRIQGEGTRRGWGRNKRVGRCGGKVERPGAPDARNERQRRHGRSGRTGHKEGTGDPGGPDAKSGRYSSGSGLCPSGEKGFFPDDPRENLLSEAFRLNDIKFYRLILL